MDINAELTRATFLARAAAEYHAIAFVLAWSAAALAA